MLLCYPHAVVKGILLESFKISNSVNSKGQATQNKQEKKHNLFSLIYLKVISLILSFVMNYPYNGEQFE